MNTPLALIVEDTEEIADFFSMALQMAGFETETALTGDVAMERLAAITPDVLVLDLHLPEVQGGDILHYVRAEQRLAGTHVIIVTADARGAESLRESADLVLVKPVGLAQLRDLAKRMITS